MILKLKPALEIEEQIKNLKIKHKLIINDTNKAKEILESVNYYRLTGYGLGLKRKGNEDKNNKNKESVHQKMLDKFHEECLRQSNMPCVKHHNEKYAGHFPL